MKFRAIIHYLNDEEVQSEECDSFYLATHALTELRAFTEDHNDEDVQFFQIEPIRENDDE